MGAQKYTDNGHSISLLKKKAEVYQKEHKISRISALDQVAQEIGYSDWNEIVQQPKDKLRDIIFDDIYKKRILPEKHLESYHAYLKREDKEDTPDNFREFNLSTYEFQKNLGTENLINSDNSFIPVILLQDLQDHVIKYGPLGLLPQNLPSYLLEGLATTYDFYYENQKTLSEEDALIITAPIMSAVKTLLEYLEKEKIIYPPNNLESAADLIFFYHMQLTFEWFSRRTKLQVERPTIENIFDAERIIKYKYLK